MAEPDLEAMFKPEPLLAELERYRFTNREGWDCIKHPLVFSIIHNEALNRMVNASLRQKRVAVREALHEGQWTSYVFLHERPFRVAAFKRIARHMTDEQYWKLLGHIWIDSENIRENPEVWERLLNSKRPCRELIMSQQERDALASLPEQIEVYQGHTDERDDGWSWTTSEGIAQWFARRFAMLEDSGAAMSVGTCEKSDVVALFQGRNEDEIVIPRYRVDISATVVVL